MRRDCGLVLLLAACPMVKKRKVQPSSSASGASGSSSSTTASGEVTARSATAASSTFMTINGGSRDVSRKVIHTASFASVASASAYASVAKENTRSYGQCVSDFLDNLKSQGLFSSPNFNAKLVDLRRRKEEFELYVVRTRERFVVLAYYETKVKLSAYEFAWVNLQKLWRQRH